MFGPALIAAVSAILVFVALHAEVTTRRAVIHTRGVLETSSSLLASLVEAETSQRGFIIARDTAFLSSDHPLKARADSLVAVLRSLTRDNAAQQRRLDTIADLSGERLIYIDSSVVAMRAGQRDRAVAIVAEGPGRRLMADIRRVMTELQGEEERVLHARERAERNATRVTSVVIVLAALGVALLAFLVNRNFDRALRDRRKALNDVRSANDRLQEQAAELEARAGAAHTAALEAESARDHAHVALASAEASERRAERLQAATEGFSGALSLTAVAQLDPHPVLARDPKSATQQLTLERGGVHVLEKPEPQFVVDAVERPDDQARNFLFSRRCRDPVDHAARSGRSATNASPISQGSNRKNAGQSGTHRGGTRFARRPQRNTVHPRVSSASSHAG